MDQGPNFDWTSLWKMLPEKDQEDLINPTAKALGDGIGGIFTWVFHKPIEYLAIERAKVDSLKHMTAEKLSKIPESKMDLEKRGTMVKELQDSIYSIDDELMREYFSTLLAKTASKDTSSKVLPYFSTLLSNLSSNEAKFLLLFKGRDSQIGDYIKESIALGNIIFYDSKTLKDHTIFSADNILVRYDNQDKIKSFSKTIDVLESLGLVKRNFGSYSEELITDLDEMKKLANLSKFEEELKGNFDIDLNSPQETTLFINKHPYDKAMFEYGELRLTSLGNSFANIVLL